MKNIYLNNQYKAPVSQFNKVAAKNNGMSLIDNRSSSVQSNNFVENLGTNPIQRVVNTANFQKTQHGQYMVDPSRLNFLFSKEDSAAPMPTGLYHVTSDTEAVTKEKLKVWIPNVKFTTQEERAFISGANATGFLKFEKSKFFGGITAQDLNSKADSVASVAPPKGVLPATVGAFGKNDCNVFATKLQTLIAHEKAVSEGEPAAPAERRDIADVNSATKKQLEVGVGDKMVHMYPKHEACKYHAATIVAKDGGSTVTLEGHVSKNLERPQFHIRNGVKGFVRDNDTKVVDPLFGPKRLESRGLGGEVQINPLGSVTGPHREKQKSDQRYKIMKGTEDGFGVNESGTVLGQDIGTTDTDSPHLRNVAMEIAEELGRMYGWGSKSTKAFAQSPEGLEKARIRIANQKKPTPSYIS